MKSTFNYVGLRSGNLSQGSAEPSREDGPSIGPEDEQEAVITAATVAMKLDNWRQPRAVTSLEADSDMRCS